MLQDFGGHTQVRRLRREKVKSWGASLALALLLSACATPRSSFLIPIQFSNQPPRAEIRSTCNDNEFTTQGVLVCEQKAPSEAVVTVKVPPVQGHVVYANGLLKKTEDFNWQPEEGFWLWKTRPISDTWVQLDLGQIAATFGDWPVALDIIGISELGALVTRGVIYHRICNDQDVPCSKLVIQYDCAGKPGATGEGEIGKCIRLSGSPQSFEVKLSGPGYQATQNGKIYVSARRDGLVADYTITQADLVAGFKKIELPAVKNGPSLVGVRAAWYEGAAIKQVETRILILGFDPEWTGVDRPHPVLLGEQIQWAKPVFSDYMEINTYEGQVCVDKVHGMDAVQTLAKPAKGQVSCAFAWRRDSSDMTVRCVDSNFKEVPVP